jgi:hypothetical protein
MNYIRNGWRHKGTNYIPIAQAVLYLSFLMYILFFYQSVGVDISTGPIQEQIIYYAGQKGYNHSFFGFSCQIIDALAFPECYENFSCIHNNETIDTHQLFWNRTIFVNDSGNPYNSSGHGYFWANTSPHVETKVCPLCNNNTWWSILRFHNTNVFSRLLFGVSYDVTVQHFRVKNNTDVILTDVVSTSYQGTSDNECRVTTQIFIGSNQSTSITHGREWRTIIYFSLLTFIVIAQISYLLYKSCTKKSSELIPIIENVQ